VPFGRNDDFVGRDQILEQLLNIIPPSATPEACQRTAIKGLGGVGKTQIALETAFKMKEEYPDCSVFWVPAVDVSSFENAYREIGRRLKVKEIDEDKVDIRSLVREAINQIDNDWLLIVDNADDVELFSGDKDLRQYLPSSPKGSILFTTRTHEAVSKLGVRSANVIHVGGMNNPEAVELLIRTSGISQLHDYAGMTELLEHLVYLPLAIKQASAFMNKNNVSIKQYLGLCRSSDGTFIKLLGKHFEDHGRYNPANNPITTTWLISFRQLSRDNQLAAQQLRFMSFLAKDVPQSILPDGVDDLDRIEAIGTLKAYAFITERAEKSSYELHRLVGLAMQNWLSQQGELRTCVTWILHRLNDIYPHPTHDNRDAWENHLPHVLAALKFGHHTTDDLTKGLLLEKVAESNQVLGHYDRAEGLYQQALELHNRPLGDQPRESLRSMNGIAKALFSQGKYDKAEKLYGELLDQQKKVLSADCPEVINTMNDLALALGSQGKLDKAEQMHRRTLELHRQVLNKEHPDTLRSMNNLGYTLRSRGKYKEAEVLYRETLEIRTRILGLKNPDTLDTMGCLALALHAQGKYNDAAKVHRQTLRLRKQVLGPEHPDTLSSMNNYAYTLRGQAKTEEAEVLDWQTLELRTKVLGSEHPDVFWSMNGLANGFRSQGKYEQAEMLYQQTLELRTKVLGPEHPNTFDSMDNLASVLESQGKYKDAEAIYRHALELGTKVRGAEHPHTLDSMNGVAHTLYSQGQFKEAEAMYWDTLELRTKALGTEHPNTLETMDGLALSIGAQGKEEPGRYKEAESLQQITFDLRTNALGPQHPDTLQSMRNLTLVKEEMGKQKKEWQSVVDMGR
jgi:tetratricopeptide (TPR) repeat protein